MARLPKTPADLARRLASSREAAADPIKDEPPVDDGWRRESFCLTRVEAQAIAKEWFERYPKAAYMTEVESWRVLDNGLIEFTMRRGPGSQ
jgi:hypothetical protein